MAQIRDIIPPFEMLQPTSLDDALALLERYRDALILAGGLDSLDWLKDRLRRPSVVVDLGGIDELRGIRPWGDGIEIGAMTTLSTIGTHPEIANRFALLRNAAAVVASPQIRNQATIGGNLSQDARCWYYRAGWPCYRAGGNICYADTPRALNREHAILGADRCVAVNPSDTAPALIALDALMVLRDRDGSRTVTAEEYFIGPGTDITKMTTLRPSEILTAVRIPNAWAGAQYYFEKVRDRNVWDFALVSVAAAKVMTGTTIERMRLAVNGVAAQPLRLTSVEDLVAGQPASESTAERAGVRAIIGCQPLAHNAYKVPLMRNLIKRAIRGVSAVTYS